MSPLLISILIGVIGTFVAVPIVLTIGQMFQLWRVLPERTVLVYTFFGKVVGQVEEPGLFFPIAHFGPKALLFPLFGKAYTVRTVIHQAYLRNQLVNSEEGAPMGVGIWFEMFVKEPKAFLFQNSDPIGSLKANVATAVVKQLSNLRLEVLLENRDALSRKVREEVTPTSSQWGFSLGSTYIRKVAFRDKGMIAEIQRKVVNRLRQVTAAMRQAGENEVDHPLRRRQQSLATPWPSPSRAPASRRPRPRRNPARAGSRRGTLHAARYPSHAPQPR